MSHDADSVPLADGVRRINNGKLAVEGADALRAVIRREPVLTTMWSATMLGKSVGTVTSRRPFGRSSMW